MFLRSKVINFEKRNCFKELNQGISMKKAITIIFLLFLLGCTVPNKNNNPQNDEVQRDANGLIIPNADGSIPVQKDRQGLVSSGQKAENTEEIDKSKEWIAYNKEKHPEWYACKKDNDCVGAQADCVSSCRLNAINSASYSDYVVEYSKYCQGYGRVVKKCGNTKVSCDNGECSLKFL